MIIHGAPESAVHRKPKKRFLDRPIAAALEAAVCLTLIALFCHGFVQFAREHEMFRVSTIRVEGAQTLPDEQVVARSGVTNEDNIFQVDIAAVRERLLKLPLVKECRVTTVFPDKVVITIEERKALATLMLNGRLYEIDQDCNVLRELDKDGGHVGPFITNVKDLVCAESGQQLTQRALMNAMAVWSAFRKTPIAHEVTVSEISAEYENRICMYCDEIPCEIRWGRDNFELQATKLDRFWKTQNRHIGSAQYVDLRFGNDVCLMPNSAGVG